MKKNHWYSQSIEHCFKVFKSGLHGLSSAQAHNRLAKYGKNQMPAAYKISFLRRLLNQFNNPLIYILIIAAVITAVLQHYVDTSVIAAVVILNALIGFIQESKAEKAIEKLKQMLPITAHAIRDGRRIKLAASLLAPGDIVLLRAGDKVPADLRLVKSNNLQIDEAMLTGESLPVEKDITPVSAKTNLAQRSSMAYSGTFVTYGVGAGIVVATGTNTEVGKISSLLKNRTYFSTPLLRQLAGFSRYLAAIITLFAFAIFFYGYFIQHYPFEEIFTAAVAFAVAIIPEGLPAIITIALTVGVLRLAKLNAIVHRLAAVETLSAVTVICTDKTGTLTRNELTVQKILTAQHQFNVTGSGYNDQGKFIFDGTAVENIEDENLLLLIKTAILCNDAEVRKENYHWHLIGNPVDGALLTLGLKAGLNYKTEEGLCPKTDTIPFSSQQKYMASLHHDHEGNGFIFVKGAPEKVLSLCQYQKHDSELTSLDKAYWSQKINQLAEEGMRVIGLAYRTTVAEHVNLLFSDVESKLVFLGFVGIIDPPREGAKKAVEKCLDAGIKVKMITGDHPLTAKAIAQQVGIKSQICLTGDNIDALSDVELSKVVNDVDIYARTIPEHKIRLIKALRKDSHIVAMTGDGVNDAPALQAADIGISMGIKGTDVAKESAEIVLADDNFTSIQHAVAEGRNIYNNLKKAILFILPNGGGEGFSIFFAILFGYTLPITPVQILWVNMVTAVTLGLSLAFEPAEKNLMQQKPRHSNEPLLTKFLIWRIAFVTLLFVLCIFGVFLYLTSNGASVAFSRTMVVNTLVILEVFYLINCRRIYDSVLSLKGIFGSIPILIAIVLVILLQIIFTYTPFMQSVFHTEPLTLIHWLAMVLIGLAAFFIVELEKKIFRFFITNKNNLNAKQP